MTAMTRMFVVVMALVVTLTTGACNGVVGGMPTSPTPPTPPPPPVADLSGLSPEARAFVMATNIEFYSGRVTRWDSFPILVYHNAELRREDVLLATQHWTSTTSGKITFQIVNDRAQAQLTLDNGDFDLLDGACATASPQNILNNVIRAGQARFVLGYRSICMDRNYDHVYIAHEIGHTLGLRGHHLPPGVDVMSDPPSLELSVIPARRDGVNWLYSTPAGAIVQ